MNRKQHWQQIYEKRSATRASWFQPEPVLSMRLLDAAGLDTHS
jgi:hypothetical protein